VTAPLQEQIDVINATLTDLGNTIGGLSNRQTVARIRAVPGPGLMLANATVDLTITWHEPMPVSGYFVSCTTEPGLLAGAVTFTTQSTTAAAAVVRVQALSLLTLSGPIIAIGYRMLQL
jgi:hypothetical protein